MMGIGCDDEGCSAASDCVRGQTLPNCDCLTLDNRNGNRKNGFPLDKCE
jgi:hypothetical protein